MNWRLLDLTSLHWRFLDGEWAVFDEGTGQTLAADAVTAACLMALEAGLTTQPEIQARVLEDLAPEDEAGCLRLVDEALSWLVMLDLAVAEPA